MRLYGPFLLLIGLLSGHTQAQSGTWAEDRFWSQLERTHAILAALPDMDRSARVEQLAALRSEWELITAVELTDGTIITIETDWLVAGMADGTIEQIDVLRQRISALLAARPTSPHAGQNRNLDAWAAVMRDPRFDYPPVTPTPLPREDDLNLPNIPTISSALSQIVLLVLGIGAIVMASIFLLRRLRPGQVNTTVPVEFADDPTTPDDAQERARTAEANGDYRSAVRYLYLASLLQLDALGLLHFEPSLTNREHLRQVLNTPDLAEPLRRVIEMFDAVWYGFEPIDSASYRAFQDDVAMLVERVG